MSRWYTKIGPGTLIAAAFIGPGTVTVCMLAGVNHGFDLLWAMVFSIVATIVWTVDGIKVLVEGPSFRLAKVFQRLKVRAVVGGRLHRPIIDREIEVVEYCLPMRGHRIRIPCQGRNSKASFRTSSLK